MNFSDVDGGTADKEKSPLISADKSEINIKIDNTNPVDGIDILSCRKEHDHDALIE